MCSLFLVLSQLQFMPKQEIPSPMKKYRCSCLTWVEVPVEEQQHQRSVAALKRRATALGFVINPVTAAV